MTNRHIQSKLPHVGTTIFTVMSKMASDYGAINLSQGFPDFEVSSKLTGLVTEAMKQGHNQYAPMQGLPEFRKVIGEVIEKSYQWEGNSLEEITVTAGATEALFSCITALIHPGDEVIVFEPAYDSYLPAIELNGGRGIPVLLNLNDFSIPWEKVEEAMTERTRMIIINSPHNPTGSVLSRSDLENLERVAEKYDLFVLSDEVYDRIVFDNTRHESVLRYSKLRKRSAAVFSFGKTFHATGWKVGYIVAPEKYTQEIRKTHQFVTFSVNTSMQWAMTRYLQDPENYLNLGTFFQHKRDFFLEAISSSRFSPMDCKGTYFQTVSYEGISDMDDISLAEKLTKENKVASIPLSVFCSPQNKTGQKLLRFCFAKSEETLEKAANILCKI